MEYDSFVLISNSRSGHSFVARNIYSWYGDITMQNPLYCNAENIRPDFLKKAQVWTYGTENAKIKRQRKTVDYSKHILIGLVSRDYLNWMASYIKITDNPDDWKGVDFSFLTGTWLSIAKEYYGETNYLPEAVKIKYEKFRDDQSYRKEICKRVGGNFNDELLEKVAPFGGGSSFDSLDYDGRASQMKTDERYKQIIGTEFEEYYWKMYNSNPEALEFYKTKCPGSSVG